MRPKFSSAALAILVLAVSLNSNLAAEPSAPSGAGPKGIVPHANDLLTKACKTLSSADALTFHAEIMFDQVLQSDVKVQFAAAADFAVQRPDELEIEYQSDLGTKKVWFSGGTLTILDPPHSAYATLTGSSTIDAMLQRARDEENLAIPLSDLIVSDPCEVILKQATYGGYVGAGDVNGVDCDHLAFSSPTSDFQVWLDRSGKPLPRKVVINYRSLPGAPEYIALLSDWKFPKAIPPGRFRPDLPKGVTRIDFLKVKEPKP